jgi:aldose 1-epimerase
MWTAEVKDNAVKFSCKKPDMEMGFPGNMEASVTYSLSDDNELKLEYEGISDKATVFNMTNHTYFALGGQDDLVNDEYDTELTLKASKFTYIVPGAIPTGELKDVEGTPMDFRAPKKIGKEIDSDWEQMTMVGGYDHNYVIDGYDGSLRKVATASFGGRTMEVYTDLPGIQFYSGNSIKPQTGKNGVKYERRSAFCLETQYFPNSVNEPSFESPVKAAGEKYHTVTIYKFV